MAFYQELDGIVNTSIAYLLENDNLVKLLYYYPEETDYQFNPLSQPRVANPRGLLMTHIYPLPKLPDAETKQTCFLNITVMGGEKPEENSGFRRVKICFDVVCHLDCWIIKGGFRPFKIMHEIDKMFNNQITHLNIVNKPYAFPFLPRDYSNKFYGFQLCYDLIISSNVGCKY